MPPDPDGERRQRLQKVQRQRRRGGLRRTLLIVLLCLAVVPPLAVSRLTPPESAFMLARRVENLRADRGWVALAQTSVPLSAIARTLQLAVIAGEDQRFPAHHGFDFVEVAQALEEASGDAPRGASTLSQQTVKNLFLWSQRHWIRKGIEAWYTVLLELVCSKQRILSLYLNFAEFGPDVYGAEAASWYFFDKPAARLSAEEAALLAAALPNPREFSVRKPGPQLRARQHWILRQMRQLGGVAYLARL
jgi:monofunctional biosynthetic peptidoglycan transglycosylase